MPQPDAYGYGAGDDTKSLPPYDHDHDGSILGKDVKDKKDRDDPFADYESSSGHGHGHGESRDALV